MGTWGLALVLKPLTTALFFCFVYVIAWCFWKLIPEGRIKRVLFSPISRKKPARNAHWGRDAAQETVVERTK